MKIEPEDLQQFQSLWKEHFHTELGEEEASFKASLLLEMMKVIYMPLPKPNPNTINQLFPTDF